jgi:hypothetical protein
MTDLNSRNLLFTAVLPAATSSAKLAARVSLGEPDLQKTPRRAACGRSRDGYGMNPHEIHPITS